MSPTDTAAIAAAARHERSYSLEGLPDREVLVFKSMVRLLGHRTHCQWVYSPFSTELRVMADGLPTASSTQSPLVQQVLTLGAGNVQRQSYLRLPLHANELEDELNRLGVLIAPVMKASTTLTFEFDEATPMRMLRWPPAGLLTTTTHMRLATLMAGKPSTLRELQQRSGENLAACTAFFNGLRRLDLLVPATAALPPALAHMQPAALKMLPQIMKSPPQPGLLMRIRMRLGLGTTGTSSQARRA